MGERVSFSPQGRVNMHATSRTLHDDLETNEKQQTPRVSWNWPK